MARPVWTGSISFGLVNVPVKAYTAVRDHDVHFHQLEKKTGAADPQQEGVGEVRRGGRQADDIEMGFEVPQGPLRHLRHGRARRAAAGVDPQASTSRDFVALDDIDPIYYERTYWLAPDGEARPQAYRCCWRRWRTRAAGRHRHAS